MRSSGRAADTRILDSFENAHQKGCDNLKSGTFMHLEKVTFCQPEPSMIAKTANVFCIDGTGLHHPTEAKNLSKIY